MSLFLFRLLVQQMCRLQEDEEAGAPSSSRVALEKAVLGVQHVSALTEGDGSEKSHLCYLNVTKLGLGTSLCMSIAKAAFNRFYSDLIWTWTALGVKKRRNIQGKAQAIHSFLNDQSCRLLPCGVHVDQGLVSPDL